MRVRIPPEAWISVASECCVLSGSGLCDGSITRAEKSTECDVSECDLETSTKGKSESTRTFDPREQTTNYSVIVFEMCKDS